ncbi:catechol 2,3-dioxygenase-like lactoylglutathione lyase family enzyme [Kineosphaera limosa]|uniref:VOC domain-containing protein n=1 Tax=Kineosphaera limosa NBRC 100340 TaxID=1184609 RepID=K6XC73_9MICO|nr:VOC family protein [Kineosphaera limosa]NYE00787.1 catechol 2,3-dioxygenase-like lactoylglutathione lyase family enzyme [Kineosphaera limosa]GAB96399.1 hypothetical protein KILIM_037_00180 [Kineosphaera limosa NBRC 100340]
MITSVHTLIYSDDATATRAFLKDVLRWPYVSESEGTDDPADWLIFGTGPSELGVHPTFALHEGREYTSRRHHEIALMCDDIDATVAELTARGASFDGEPRDMGFGVGVRMEVPGADEMLLYAPKHGVAYGL